MRSIADYTAPAFIAYRPQIQYLLACFTLMITTVHYGRVPLLTSYSNVATLMSFNKCYADIILYINEFTHSLFSKTQQIHVSSLHKGLLMLF